MKSIVTTIAVFLVAGTALFGCARTSPYVATGTEYASGANAFVEVEALETGNYMVDLNIEYLTPPERVDPQAEAYVVWFTEGDGSPRRIGTLNYDQRSRRGEFRATTPTQRFDVLVTAEQDSDADQPSELVVVRTSVDGPTERRQRGIF